MSECSVDAKILESTPAGEILKFMETLQEKERTLEEEKASLSALRQASSQQALQAHIDALQTENGTLSFHSVTACYTLSATLFIFSSLL